MVFTSKPFIKPEFKIENVEADASPQNTKTFISRLVPHGSYINDMA